jgi:hypothetical protein
VIATRTYDKLFAGIRVSPPDRARAESAIRRAFVDQQHLGPITTREKWGEILKIQQVRDSVLVSLVQDSTQRKRLADRLEDARPKSSRWP